MRASADSLLDLLPTENNPNRILRDAGIDSTLSVTKFLGGVLQGNERADTRWQYATATD